MTVKKWLLLVTLALVVIVLVIGRVLGSVGTVAASTTTVEEVIIGFTNGTSPLLQQALIANYGYTILDRNDALNCVLVRVSREDTPRIMNCLAGEDVVRYAEPNKRVQALYTPNDPRYPDQWGPQSIKADLVWDHEQGNKNVTVAIIDTGIDYAHPDLSTNYIAGGFDWVNYDTDPMDDHGHGTHCAGIVAATLDNEKGIAGIAQVNLMAEKVLDETGWGTDWYVSQGIVHATDYNADIISLSLRSADNLSIMEDACRYAWNNGCLLVAASGNANNSTVSHPAAYETVMAIGAIDQNDQRCGFSNWGPELDLVAPGVEILSSSLFNGYASLTGTSMAAPHVAGVAALVWSKYPFLTNHEIRIILTQTADDLGLNGFDDYYGYGKVNALNATTLSTFDTNQAQKPYPSISGKHSGTITPNQTIIVSKLYTYPCPGTGAHTKYARIWNPTLDVNASWNGYTGDWQNISFNKIFVLEAGKTYNYTIHTGSYPQIHHTTTFPTAHGWINCTEFTDVNGEKYLDWIPAIRLTL